MERNKKYWKILKYLLQGRIWWDGKRFRVDKYPSFLAPESWVLEQIVLLCQLKKLPIPNFLFSCRESVVSR